MIFLYFRGGSSIEINEKRCAKPIMPMFVDDSNLYGLGATLSDNVIPSDLNQMLMISIQSKN